MTPAIMLDTGPLSMISHPHWEQKSADCFKWLNRQLSKGMTVIIPEICDYEVRRELLRAKKTKSLMRLDDLKDSLYYSPITTEIMLQAAKFWAIARNQGKPTAPSHSLDADMILVAHAKVLGDQIGEILIATTNVRHIQLFANSVEWQTIL